LGSLNKVIIQRRLKELKIGGPIKTEVFTGMENPFKNYPFYKKELKRGEAFLIKPIPFLLRMRNGYRGVRSSG